MSESSMLQCLASTIARTGLPGVFPVLVEPLHRRWGPSDHVTATASGLQLDLDLRDYVQRKIYYGCYENELVSFLQRVLAPGDRVIDIGANIGYLSLVSAKSVGSTGRVQAFEPVPGNVETLRRLAMMNAVDWIDVHQVALSDSAGTLWLGSEVASENARHAGGNFHVGAPNATLSANAVRLDEVLDVSGSPRVMKLDTEGYEPAVLRGAARLLAGEQKPDVVVTELSAPLLARAGYTPSDLIAPLRDAGYKLHRLTPRARLRPAAGIVERLSRPSAAIARTTFGQALDWARGRPSLVTLVATSSTPTREIR